MTVQLTDKDISGKLENYCYTECNDSSDAQTKEGRGLVYKDGKPFLKSFGYTPHHTQQNIPKEVLSYLTSNIKNLRFFDAHEGTLLRVFYNDVNDTWYLSTHKKLDARKSRWGSMTTFGEKFDSLIPENFYQNLNKDYHYMILLSLSEDNRIVCTKYLNNLFHVGTFNHNFNLSFDVDIGIPRPQEYKFESMDQLFSFVNNPAFRFTDTQGILIADGNTNTNIKILNTRYTEYSAVRGNVASIPFRSLQVRLDVHNKAVFTSMYPAYTPNFEEYENTLYTISKQIFAAYMARFVEKKFIKVSPDKFRIIKLCHSWHQADKSNNKMSLEKVIRFVNMQDAIYLNRIIKQYKLDLKEKQGGSPEFTRQDAVVEGQD